MSAHTAVAPHGIGGATPSRQTGRIGPNVLIQTAHALDDRFGRAVAEHLLLTSTQHTLDTLPTEMVDEAAANALMRRLVDTLGLEEARSVMYDAGLRTGDYLLANRIPWIARQLLPPLPSRVALRILLAAIGQHTWTFAGSADVRLTHGNPALISLTHCPLCAGQVSAIPRCDFYTGTFARLAQRLLGPHGFAEEIACEARGDAACRFVMGTRV